MLEPNARLFLQANELVRQQIAELRSRPLPQILAQQKKTVVLEDREKFNTMLENLQVC